MRPLADKIARFGPDWRTLLSALGIAAAWPPWDFAFLAGVALVPWLACVRTSASHGRAILQGFWLSFALGLFAAPWLAVGVREFLGLPWPLALLVLVLFAATCAQPHFILFAPFVRGSLRRLDAASQGARAAGLCLALALLGAGLDHATPRLFDVGLGYALHDSARLRQLAELGGVSLLTALLLAVNLLAWRILEAWRERAWARGDVLACGATLLVLLAAALLHGEHRQREILARTARAERSVRAALLQGNVPNATRLAWARGDERAAEEQLSTYMSMTERLIEADAELDLVVWPEATFPGIFQQPGNRPQQGRANKFDRQVLRLDTPLVFGGYDMETIDGRSVLYNGLFAITPHYARRGQRGFVQRYHKHHLLPFAETLPGVSDAGRVRRWLPALATFGRGAGPGAFRIVTPGGEAFRVAPIICSESIAAAYVLDSVREAEDGAAGREASDLILNVGSDGWFGARGAPQFHLAIARFRSIETRRPQLRVANTGISALIAADGSLVARTGSGTQETLSVEVPLAGPLSTPMLRWGDWFGWSALVAGAAALGLLSRTANRTAG